ncbi:MAG TPA: MaoC family dehydratase N-terminal domain-containing protein [Anaeromyxobacteraceae bacterium]|nr:MaoC family dehydratase N-terminal domain-containing protein [Anaeromyxobacteraceae bacterium]
MLDRSLIGRQSEPVTHEVERGMIRRFADAIGDPNPIYSDESAAKAAGFSQLVAPPTFAAALTANERFRAGLDLGTRSFLLSDQQFEYGRPIFAGDRITVVTRVADVQERAGATDILVLEDEGRDAQGQFVFHSRTTLVLRRP